jgi:hypothetical protein
VDDRITGHLLYQVSNAPLVRTITHAVNPGCCFSYH